MYTRIVTYPKHKSFFLFGPRGTGKSTWIKKKFKDSAYIDLLEAEIYTRLKANPQRLADYIPEGHSDWILIDEIQKIPELLDEVHRRIELYKQKFILTGSSARKLKRSGVNLLAGRALNLFMHPLTRSELGSDFSLSHAVRFGMLPSVYVDEDPKSYLSSYVTNYVNLEVQQEGLVRNIGSFYRFLEVASFSQGASLNISAVARDCSIDRKVVEDYFYILEDLLIGVRIPVFTKRAKRVLKKHPKFYFFDAGVYRAIRPMGPLDSPEEVEGPTLETLFLQELRALNDYGDLGYEIYYWHTKNNIEVDFVIYGPRGTKAFEVKRGRRFNSEDLKGLKAFHQDYPKSECYFIYGGEKRLNRDGITILPLEQCFDDLQKMLE